VFAAILLVAGVWAVTLALLDRDAFWITDNANKFLQVRAILASDYTDFSLPWPGREIDPGFEFNPLPAPFSRVERGKLWSQYPPLFATVSSVPFRWFGPLGLYLLPLAASVLTLVGLARLTARVGPNARAPGLAVLLAGLGTPVWFYSVVFWEHAVAVAAAVWALERILASFPHGARRDLVLAGLLAAVAIAFREDMLLYAVALAVVTAARSPGRRLGAPVSFLAVVLLGLVPVFLFQWATLGTPLGHHVQSNLDGFAKHLASRPIVFYRHLLAWGAGTVPSIALGVPCVALFAVFPRLGRKAFDVAVPVLAAVASVASGFVLVGFLTAGSPIVHLQQANSLFAGAPLVLLGLIRSGDTPPGAASDTRSIWLACASFALLHALAAPAISSQGIHWGNRYLLVLYALLVVPAACNLARWLDAVRPVAVRRGMAVAGALVLGVALQAYSIHLLREKKSFSHRLNDVLTARPEPVVVTDIWWAPQEMVSVFYDKPIFLVRSREQLGTLTGRLLDSDMDEFLFVRGVPNRRPAGSAVVVDDGDLDFFTLRLVSMRISETPRRAGSRDVLPSGGRTE
jgi:hypothetical protein